MGLIKLFKKLRKLKIYRKNYYIKPEVQFHVDKDDYLFAFLPTIDFLPWIYRPNGVAIIDIWWLHMHITIGEWCRKEDK